jgi:hypothetical protein
MEIIQHANVTISPDLAVCQLALAISCLHLGQLHCGMMLGSVERELSSCYRVENLNLDEVALCTWIRPDARMACLYAIRIPYNRTHACIYDHVQIGGDGAIATVQLEECTYVSSVGSSRCGATSEATYPAYVPVGWEAPVELLSIIIVTIMCGASLIVALYCCYGIIYTCSAIEEYIKIVLEPTAAAAPPGYDKLDGVDSGKA